MLCLIFGYIKKCTNLWVNIESSRVFNRNFENVHPVWFYLVSEVTILTCFWEVRFFGIKNASKVFVDIFRIKKIWCQKRNITNVKKKKNRKNCTFRSVFLYITLYSKIQPFFEKQTFCTKSLKSLYKHVQINQFKLGSLWQQ